MHEKRWNHDYDVERVEYRDMRRKCQVYMSDVWHCNFTDPMVY